MDKSLARSAVQFLLQVPSDTKKDHIELYMEWQNRGNAVYDHADLIYILHYFEKMKNQDRNFMREIAIMDGFIPNNYGGDK